MKFTDSTPIFAQIASMVEGQIANGDLASEARVPSTRELAIELAVNPATVMRAYEHLTERGVIRQQRGLGYFVCPDADRMVRELRRTEFLEHTAPAFFGRMNELGITLDELQSHLTIKQESV